MLKHLVTHSYLTYKRFFLNKKAHKKKQTKKKYKIKILVSYRVFVNKFLMTLLDFFLNKF